MKRRSNYWLIGLACLQALAGILISSGHSQDGAPALVVESPQLITGTPDTLYQYKFGGASPASWHSGNLGGYSTCVGGGDIDNCGTLELYAVTTVFDHSERIDRKTSRSYFRRDLHIFESGAPSGALVTVINLGEFAGDGPELQPVDVTTSFVRDSRVVDVDHDGWQELVVIHGSHLDIYQFRSGTLFYEAHSTAFSSSTLALYGLDVGDSDNDGLNEIVVTQIGANAPYVIKFDGTSFAKQSVSPCTTYRKGSSSLSVDEVKVRDCDNLPDITRDGIPGLKGNEIVAGGNNNRLMIWKYNPGAQNYDLQFVSSDLGYFTQGVDAGDIDGSRSNEIVIASCAINRTPPCLWVFAYDGATYKVTSRTSFPSGQVMGLEMGDLDGDGFDEVIEDDADVANLFDFDLGAGQLKLTWSGTGGCGASEIR